MSLDTGLSADATAARSACHTRHPVLSVLRVAANPDGSCPLQTRSAASEKDEHSPRGCGAARLRGFAALACELPVDERAVRALPGARRAGNRQGPGLAAGRGPRAVGSNSLRRVGLTFKVKAVAITSTDQRSSASVPCCVRTVVKTSP